MNPNDQAITVSAQQGQAIQDEAKHLAQEFQSLLTRFLATGKGQAAHAIDEVATAAEQMSQQLRTDQQPAMAEAVATLAQQIHHFTGKMQQNTLEETVHDIEQAAKNHRGFLVAGGLVLGLLAAKLANDKLKGE